MPLRFGSFLRLVAVALYIIACNLKAWQSHVPGEKPLSLLGWECLVYGGAYCLSLGLFQFLPSWLANIFFFCSLFPDGKPRRWAMLANLSALSFLLAAYTSSQQIRPEAGYYFWQTALVMSLIASYLDFELESPAIPENQQD